ncbi:MAG: chemotaxis protein CheW [Methylobacter sp.]|nr:chemotaxis protein CheW [Methylobacter sp.]
MQAEEFEAVDHTNADLPSRPQAEVETVFGIRIGSMGFLVSTAIYCEVLDKIQVNALPNVHPWLSGLLNLRGNLVPVFDLRIVLEEEAAGHIKRRLFTIDRGDKTVALWIDGFPEVKDSTLLQQLKELPPLPQILQQFVTDGYEQDGQVWLNVKFDDLFKTLGRHQYTTEEMAA